MKRVTSSLALAAALAVGGCSNSGFTYGSYYDSRYDYTHVNLAASDGPVPVQIKGNPLPVPPAQFADGLLAAMQEKNFPPRLRFTTAAPEKRSYDYRVVMAFGDPPVGYNDLCKTPDVPIAPAAQGRVDAKAFFCYGDLILTYASGSLSGVTSPQDPRFERFITQVVLELFPIYDPRGRGNRDIRVSMATPGR
jgi:hypothetical protein